MFGTPKRLDVGHKALRATHLPLPMIWESRVSTVSNFLPSIALDIFIVPSSETCDSLENDIRRPISFGSCAAESYGQDA